MATLTIVITTDSPNTGDIKVKSAGSVSYGVYIPSGAHQTKQLVQKLESLVQSELGLTQ
jgi:hypothetical protein